jgi:hypothetical protein
MEFIGTENILNTLDIYATQIENFSLTDLPPSLPHIVYAKLNLI